MRGVRGGAGVKITGISAAMKLRDKSVIDNNATNWTRSLSFIFVRHSANNAAIQDIAVRPLFNSPVWSPGFGLRIFMDLGCMCASVIAQGLQILRWGIARNFAARTHNESRSGLLMTHGDGAVHIGRSSVA